MSRSVTRVWTSVVVKIEKRRIPVGTMRRGSSTPWVLCNIPIPPGIYNEVCEAIRRKLTAGTFKPSNSSYCSHWFCIVKKDGKSLRIVQSLEPLNQVTIQHSGVPPFTKHLAEQFASRACGSMLDLFVGYDERALAESSRDYTTFQTPFGACYDLTYSQLVTPFFPIHIHISRSSPCIYPIPPHTHIPFLPIHISLSSPTISLSSPYAASFQVHCPIQLHQHLTFPINHLL